MPKQVDIEVVKAKEPCPEPVIVPMPCAAKKEEKTLEITLQQDKCCKKKEPEVEKDDDKPQWSCEKKAKEEAEKEAAPAPEAKAQVHAASSHQDKQYHGLADSKAQVDNSGYSYGNDDSIITSLFGW